MRYVVSADEMKRADRKTTEEYGLTPEILIEHAASSVYEKLEASEDLWCKSAVIFCGTGNNGADGLALSRMLSEGGCDVICVLVGDRSKATKENEFELNAAKKKKVYIATTEDFLKDGCFSFDLVIDAIFGVGLSREVSGEFKTAIAAAERCEGKKIALDIPSGISSDTGKILGVAFNADVTYTFSFLKRGMLFYPGRTVSGKVVLCRCGIAEDALDKDSKVVCIDDFDIPHILPSRSPSSHKGNCGKVLAVAGSSGMSGAALFCAQAAYRAGAGLVKIMTHRDNLIPLQGALPEALYTIYSDSPDPEAVKEAVQWADVVLIGPGLGKSDISRQLLESVITVSEVPMVMDADALNLISEDLSLLSKIKGPAVLTPHLKEMERLTGEKASDIEEDMIKSAVTFADKYRVTVVLKSAVSVIAEPEGKVFINTTGCDALAKGGSGDILSGFTAGLMAQGGGNESVAAAAAAYICGKNAEYLAEKMSGRSVMAMDLLDEIGEVLLSYGK